MDHLVKLEAILQKISENQISETNAYIIFVIIALITSILGYYWGAYFKKKAEINVMNENFNNYLDQQKNLAKDIEIIKSEIGKDNIRYQIKLSEFNSKSFEILDQIFTKLIDFKNIMLEFYMNSPNGEKIINALDVLNQMKDFFDMKRIWIENDLEDKIFLLIKDVEKATFSGLNALSIRKRSLNLTPEQINDIHSKEKIFEAFINNELNLRLDELTNLIKKNLLEHH